MGTLLTANRGPLEGRDRLLIRGVEANTTIFISALVAIDSNGLAVPAQPLGDPPLDTLEVVGIMQGVLNGEPGAAARNTVGAANLYPLAPGASIGDAGAIKIEIVRGVFGFDNDGSLSNASIAGCPLVFAVDDHTVGIDDAGATLPCVGRAVYIGEFNLVFVDTRDKFATAKVAGY